MTTSGPRPMPGLEGSPTRRAALAVAGVVAVLAVSLAALLARPAGVAAAAAPTSAPATQVAATGHVTQVTVTIEGMAFTPDRIEVPAGDELEITVVNDGEQRHDLVLSNGATSGPIAPGDEATVRAGVIGADLEGWCSLPGHRQMGMVLQVVAIASTDPDHASTDPDHASSGTDTDTGTDTDGADMDGMDMGGAAGGATTVPTAAQLEAAAEAADPAPAVLPPLDDSTLHEYTFTVTESTQEVVPGLTRQVWTYNGTSPGPVLHGRVGDTFRITLVNDGSMGHSIDFHAGELAPDEPMRTIEPGESLVYTFTADRSGIWMYHCSTMPMSQHIANGMFGAVVIEPDGLESVDRQYVLIQSEQYLGADGEAADAAKVATGIPDLVTFNGRAFGYDAHPLTATVGERVRFWVLDVGPNLSWSFHVVGTQFDTVWSEGAYSVRHGVSADGLTAGSTGSQALALLAAQGGFVELVPQEAGHYAIVNHEMSLAEKGAHGILAVTD